MGWSRRATAALVGVAAVLATVFGCPVAAAGVPPQHRVDVPPPPHPAPPPGCAPTTLGPRASPAEVRAALVAAGGTQFWAHAASPPLVGDARNGPRAVITVPPALIEAVAWQESGWASNIVSCDGGRGVLQLMAATADWMNHRFGTAFDYAGLPGNAALGAEYLEWLVAYFGENFFGHHYDLANPDLLAAVLVAYNAGPNSVVFAGGRPVVSHYAATVEALMARHPWG